MYKQGDYIRNEEGKRKILGVCGDICFISGVDNYEFYDFALTFRGLDCMGYTLVETEWEPSYGEKYYYIQGSGDIGISSWFDCKTDNARKNFLGVFKSQEAAQARLQEIKTKLDIK